MKRSKRMGIPISDMCLPQAHAKTSWMMLIFELRAETDARQTGTAATAYPAP